MPYEGKSTLEGAVTFKSATFGIFLYHISISGEDEALNVGKITVAGLTEPFTRQAVHNLIAIGREQGAQYADLDTGSQTVVDVIKVSDGNDVVEVEVIMDDDKRLLYMAELHLTRRAEDTDELYFGRLQAVWDEFAKRTGPLKFQPSRPKKNVLWPATWLAVANSKKPEEGTT